MQRFVVDTNVVFEGLTKQGSASGILIEAWIAGLFYAYVSNTMAYEYSDVLYRKLSAPKLQTIYPAFSALLLSARNVRIHYTWRPISPDPGDDHVIDCAMNAGASIVTWNARDFRSAREALGVSVLTPVDAVLLVSQD